MSTLADICNAAHDEEISAILKQARKVAARGERKMTAKLSKKMKIRTVYQAIRSQDKSVHVDIFCTGDACNLYGCTCNPEVEIVQLRW